MKRLLARTVIFLALMSDPALCGHLQIVTDYYPPLSYEENGEIKGISTRVVRAALREAGMEATITQYPFKRAYTMTLRGENIFEYCVSKTPKRVPLFKWVGIVAPSVQVLYALKERNIRIEKPENLKEYIIGTVLEDVVDQHLSSGNSISGLRLDRVADYKLNMKKLFKGRIDLWGGNELVGLQLARDMGYKSTDLTVAHKIDELTDNFYLVTGRETPDELVKKLSAAFNTIHTNGTYQDIIQRFMDENK